MGSATPSLESYEKGVSGSYQLLTLDRRYENRALPKVYTVDLKEELKAGNRSIFSGLLQEKIKDRLEKKEQIILFLNRRGYTLSLIHISFVISGIGDGGQELVQHPSVSGMYQDHAEAAFLRKKGSVYVFLDGTFNDLFCHRADPSARALAFHRTIGDAFGLRAKKGKVTVGEHTGVLQLQSGYGSVLADAVGDP